MRPRKPLSVLAGLLLFGASTLSPRGALAQEVRAVVELFTSQGCSSCPPADAHVADLVRQPGVIAITLPVDYWDYLGWKDTLASPDFSKRQRHYAKARGDGQVYTPQLVVNGASHHVGSDKAAIARALPAGALPVKVALAGSESAPEVRILAADGTARAGSIWLLPIMPSAQVVIGRGENRGRTITYTHVARDLVRLGDWRGEAMTVPVPTDVLTRTSSSGFVIVLHAEGGKPGRIIGAVASRNLATPGS